MADVVVFTGRLVKWSRKEASNAAVAKGYKVGASVTSSTTILVYGDDAGKKIDDAKKKGIKIYSEEEWAAKLGATGGDDDEDMEDATETESQPTAPLTKGTKRKQTKTQDEPASPKKIAVEVAVEFDAKTAAVNGTKPQLLIEDGHFHDVKSSSSNSTYVIKRTGSAYTCNCPAWRNQRLAPGSRTCKHLKQVLGEEYEAIRVKSAAAPVAVPRTATRASSPTKKSSSPTSSGSVKCTAPDVLLAKKWDREKNNPTNWWISEKLDGVRAYWDAKRQLFLSRLGNSFPAPDWFIEGLPKDMDLDGEIFGGRGRFQFTVGIAKTANSPHWDQLVYKVFDIPSLKQQPFEERMKQAQALVKKAKSKHVEWVEHTQCKSLTHLDEEFDKIEKLGGEGLMIREPGSKYSGGRSSSLLKIKSFHDGEAIVIAYEDGKGKYKGMCGALRCKMASGKMFKCASGLSDAQREDPPAIGSIIVYKCQELTNDGIPRFPVFVGEAADKDRPTDPIIANAVGRDD